MSVGGSPPFRFVQVAPGGNGITALLGEYEADAATALQGLASSPPLRHVHLHRRCPCRDRRRRSAIAPVCGGSLPVFIEGMVQFSSRDGALMPAAQSWRWSAALVPAPPPMWWSPITPSRGRRVPPRCSVLNSPVRTTQGEVGNGCGQSKKTLGHLPQRLKQPLAPAVCPLGRAQVLGPCRLVLSPGREDLMPYTNRCRGCHFCHHYGKVSHWHKDGKTK